MKYIYFTMLLTFSTVSIAETLCPISNKINPSIRIAESHFTKENAEAAAQKIGDIVSGTDISYEWVTVPNLQKVIQGYTLKRDAEAAEGALVKFKKAQFCAFMAESAWWYD
jgi:hypothetical protein